MNLISVDPLSGGAERSLQENRGGISFGLLFSYIIAQATQPQLALAENNSEVSVGAATSLYRLQTLNPQEKVAVAVSVPIACNQCLTPYIQTLSFHTVCETVLNTTQSTVRHPVP